MKRQRLTRNRDALQFEPHWLPMGLGLLHNTTHESIPGLFLTDRKCVESWLRTRPDIDANGFKSAWIDWLAQRAKPLHSSA